VLLDLRETAGFLRAGLQLIDQVQQTLMPPAMIPLLSGDDPALRQLVLEKGAYDTVKAPPDVARLRTLLERAHTWVCLRRQADGPSLTGPQHQRLGTLIVASQAMRSVVGLARKIAGCDVTALITGETGTGKELVTRAIHEMSRRSGGPFVAFSCANLPETLIDDELFGHERGAFTGATAPRAGRFEMADGGTLFLDEIGELSPLLQAKLLRVLEDQVIRRVGGIRDMQVNVRVIAASNRDLEKAVRDGEFRQDLYYRLAIIAIFIPPLRDRKEDIMPLVDFFIDRYNRRFKKSIRGVTEETRRLIFSHNWPGNVRELKNTIERGMILEDEPFLRPLYLPFSVGESGGRTVFERTSPADGGQTLPNGRSLPRLYIPEGGTSLEEVEHAMVELAMRQANGNQTHAAKLLDISRDALRYKLKKFGMIRGDEEGTQTVAAEEPT